MRTLHILGAAAVLALAAVVAPAHAQAAGSILRVSAIVDASIRGVQNTGVHVNPGATVIILVSGKVSWTQDQQVGPNGWPDAPFAADVFDPDLPALSVIGDVGDGHWFFVGAGFAHKFTSTTNGQLYLAFNDSYFGDNSGSFSALIVCSGCSARR